MGRVGIFYQVERSQLPDYPVVFIEIKYIGCINGETNFHRLFHIFHAHLIINFMDANRGIEPNFSFEGTQEKLFHLLLIDPLDLHLSNLPVEFFQWRLTDTRMNPGMVNLIDKLGKLPVELVYVKRGKVIDQGIKQLTHRSVEAFDLSLGQNRQIHLIRTLRRKNL